MPHKSCTHLCSVVDSPELPKRSSLDSVRDSSDAMHSVLEIIKLQARFYKDHLREQKETIRDSNTFDPEILSQMIIHTGNPEDKEKFKNAVVFMQNKLNLVLESLE